MKENESALYSHYIIDGVRQEMTPAELLDECMEYDSGEASFPDSGEEFSDDATVKTEEADESLQVEKEAAIIKAEGNTQEEVAELGDTIKYTVTITNNGNQTLENIAVTDTLVELAEADRAIEVLAKLLEREANE